MSFFNDLQVLTDKVDTMYRYYKKLSEREFFLLKKIDGKDYVSFLPKLKTWNEIKNSENNPTEMDAHPNEVGQSSENNSDAHPTNSNNILYSKNNIVKEDKTLFGDSVQEISFLPEDILNHLNTELQKKFPKKRGFGPVDSNLKDIKARILDKKVKYSLDDFKAVIEFKIDKWHGKEKTKKWLRPSTLFGEKFDQYLTEALESNEQGGSWGNSNFVESQSTESDLI